MSAIVTPVSELTSTGALLEPTRGRIPTMCLCLSWRALHKFARLIATLLGRQRRNSERDDEGDSYDDGEDTMHGCLRLPPLQTIP
jgi:hypothetical protein